MLIISRFASKLHQAFSELFPTVGPDEITIQIEPSKDKLTVTIEEAQVFAATLSAMENVDHLWFSVNGSDSNEIAVRIGIPYAELIA